MNAPYLHKETIRQYATELLKQYAQARGKPVTFPLDAADLFERLFGLVTIYDDQGVLNGIEPGLIGCLFPDGHISPWGQHKVIAVNMSRLPLGNPRLIGGPDVLARNQNFTVAHEGAGHYLLHFLKGIGGTQYRRPAYCRSAAGRDPLEWQADFMAGEVVTPYDQVIYILDSEKPPAVINVEECWPRYRDYFGANRTMMETRLHVLGYKLVNAMNDWADYSAEERERNERIQKELQTKAELEKLMRTFPQGIRGIFGGSGDIFSSFKNPFKGLDQLFGGEGFFGVHQKRPQPPKK